MKISKLLMICMLVGLSLGLDIQAQDAFVPGTVWTTYLEGCDYPNPSTGWETAELQAGNEGEDLMRMVVSVSDTRGSEEVYLIRKENGRIYFSYPTEQPVWQLLYDFNMEAEDGCEICSPWGADGMPYFKTYDECVGTRVNDQGLTEMTMKEYEEFPEDHYSPYYSTNVWFKGIGSRCGVMRSNYSCVVGTGFMLVEVRNGDTVFYSNPAAVKDLALTRQQIAIENGKLTYRDLPENTQVILCGLDGRIIKQTTVVGNGSVELVPGLNIVRVGETVLKGFGH